MRSVILDSLVDFIFPKFCVVCSREGEFLCQKCKKSLPGALQVCPMCTRPSIYGLTHDYCRKKYGMDGLMAVFDHKDAGVKKVIEAVKFGFNRKLVSITLEGWKLPTVWKRMVFVPVPLHRYRENWRGFNQAELVTEALGRVEVEKALKRIRKTGQQARVMNKRERWENIKGAFAVTEVMVRGKKIILVDDVFTSGATMLECAKELKKAGAREVWGFVLAR